MATMTVYDVAAEATNRADKIEYPPMPAAPNRGDYDTPQKYGRAVGRYEAEKEKVRAARDQWSTKQADVEQWFKTEIARVLELEGHPKFDTLFRIAWSEGHSSGFNEVAIYWSHSQMTTDNLNNWLAQPPPPVESAERLYLQYASAAQDEYELADIESCMMFETEDSDD